ncbi:MAG: nicotinate-nicotinamide nucleotide adenylyltransferase [Pseudomonadota bacterium]
MRTIGLLGGSFNPIHIGHIRLAVEIMEALKPDRLDLIPCAQAPHKAAKGFLPFEMRCDLVDLAVKELYGQQRKDCYQQDTKITKEKCLQVNRLEGQRQGPSYTWDTLIQYGEKEKDARLFFVLGGEDFCKLSSWYRGLEIPYLTDIVVVPRDSANLDAFTKTIEKDWPEAKASSPSTWALPNGNCFIYQPLPRLDISASLLREKWIKHQDISFLLPTSVIECLEQHRQDIEKIWST